MQKVIAIMVIGVSLAMVATSMVAIEHHMVPERGKEMEKVEEEKNAFTFFFGKR